MTSIEGSGGCVCVECGAAPQGLSLVMGADAPDSWRAVPAAARAEGALSRDQCYLPWEGRTYTFLRGHVAIPLIDHPDEAFVWAVWSTMAPDDMDALVEAWDDPHRQDLDPVPGRLANALPYDPPTTGLELHIHQRQPGSVPLFRFAPECDHPLALEQRRGITRHRVAELNRLLGY